MSKRLALTLLMACGSKPTTGSVTITQWPGKIEIIHEHETCWFPDKPTPPEVPEWPTADEDYYRRVYVHRADYEKLLQYIADRDHYDEYVLQCIKALTAGD